MLDYCIRFYDRQFITRENVNHDLFYRFETGLSALKHIQQKTLEVAKERVFNTAESISEISYELGFPYPQHFSRWFKKMTGYTPNEYRKQNN